MNERLKISKRYEPDEFKNLQRSARELLEIAKRDFKLVIGGLHFTRETIGNLQIILKPGDEARGWGPEVNSEASYRANDSLINHKLLRILPKRKGDRPETSLSCMSLDPLLPCQCSGLKYKNWIKMNLEPY